VANTGHAEVLLANTFLESQCRVSGNALSTNANTLNNLHCIFPQDLHPA
jgi:hypothetical protein